MADIRWTQAQEAAIETRGCNLLVAAGAGAGKTAVLVERVLRRVTDSDDPVDIDRLLVVTFTEAAAAEMRERIGRVLAREAARSPGSARLRQQLALLQRATITTMHSFCAEVLRQNFYRLDLDPAFRVANENEAELLQVEVLEKLFEGLYGESDSTFLALVDQFGGQRDDTGLGELVLKLYDFSRSNPWPEGWLKDLAEKIKGGANCLDGLPWIGVLKQAVQRELKRVLDMLQEALKVAQMPGGPARYVETLCSDLETMEALLEACLGSWADLHAGFNGIVFEQLPRVSRQEVDEVLKEHCRGLREEAKKRVRELAAEYFSRDPGAALEDLDLAAGTVEALAGLTLAFTRRYQEAKLKRGLVDFSDLEHFCLRVLLSPEASPENPVPSPVALDLRQRFAEVLVDEYQDINAVQEAILHLVSRQGERSPNLFMVGDVKQSIYRFRLADPGLFLRKYRSFPEVSRGAAGKDVGTDAGADAGADAGTAVAGGAPGTARSFLVAGAPEQRVELAENFRSRRGVVDAVNFIFRQIMTTAVGELPYDRRVELVCAACFPEADRQGAGTAGGGSTPRPSAAGPEVELHLIERKPGDPEGVWGLGSDDEDGSMGDGSSGSDLHQQLEELESAQVEARIIARRIRRMVKGEEFLVWDRGQGRYRPVTFRDIVVLMRAARGRAETFLEEFRQAGIPAYADVGTGFFAATEVETLLSLLKVIDNPRQDIPLAGVLRSPIGGFNAADLARIRLSCRRGDFYDALKAVSEGRGEDLGDLQGRSREFLARLDRWRTLARRGPLSDLIWQIYRDTGYYDYVGALPGGSQRQANLRALHHRARQYEATSFRGLFRFLRFVERLRERGEDLGTARSLGENEDVVRVMSVHKSKGLEFPVVMVAGLGQQFNLQDLRQPVLMHKDLGLGVDIVDTGLRVRYPSLAKLALREKLRAESLAEEMRVLYVALTRAMEKLILFGSVAGVEEALASWCRKVDHPGWALPDPELARAKTYLDWLVPAVARHKDGRPLRDRARCTSTPPPDIEQAPGSWQVVFWQVEDALEDEAAEASDRSLLMEKVRNLEPVPVGSGQAEIVEARLSWKYPQHQVVGKPAKVSVSELKYRWDPGWGGPGDTEEVLPGSEEFMLVGSREPNGSQGYARAPVLPRHPRFLQEPAGLSRVEMGSAVHLVMQHLDLTGRLDEAGIEEQVALLKKKGVISEAEAEAVDPAAVAGFFRSEIGKRVLSARRVLRETPFTLAVPAREIYPDLPGERGEKVLVQGIIDLLADEGDGFLLVDFKTDQVGPQGVEGILDRYRVQLHFYSRAVEEILGRRVKEKYLYLFATGEAVRCD